MDRESRTECDGVAAQRSRGGRRGSRAPSVLPGLILVAVLLGLAFTPRFPDLSGAQHGVYLVTLVLSAVSAALLIAPVGYHRTVFRQRLRPHAHAAAGLQQCCYEVQG